MTAPRRPSFPELIDWLEGRLPAGRAAEVAAHVDADADLSQDVAWARGFLASVRDAPLARPPDEVRNAVRAMFREKHRARGAHAARPVRLALLFDSRSDRTPTGVRAIDAGPAIQLAYTGDVADLVLDVHTVSDGVVRIDGQVFLRDDPAPLAAVSVRSADGAVHVGCCDDPLGRFAVPDVPAGPVEVQVRAGAVDLVVDADVSGERDVP